MWLIGYLAGSFCEWLLGACVALWLWLAGWLACYVAAHVAGWLCGSLALELGGCGLLAHRRRGWLIAGWAAGCLHG